MKPRRRIPIKERFERLYVPEPNSGCWLWLGAVNRSGYGFFDEGADRTRKDGGLWPGRTVREPGPG